MKLFIRQNQKYKSIDEMWKEGLGNRKLISPLTRDSYVMRIYRPSFILRSVIST